MTWIQIYDVVVETAIKLGQPEDEFLEEITNKIIDDNGFNLAHDEIQELTEQFFEEEDE